MLLAGGSATQHIDIDAVHGAASRLRSYVTERAAMGGKDVIHGYLDGAGVMVVELRTSDVQLLVDAPVRTRPSAARTPEPNRQRQREQVECAVVPGTGDEQEDRRRMAAAEALLAAWPGQLGEEVLAAVVELDAFGALAWKLDRLRRDGGDPVAVLREIDPDTVGWAIRSAHNPAAFLASRVQKLGSA